MFYSIPAYEDEKPFETPSFDDFFEPKTNFGGQFTTNHNLFDSDPNYRDLYARASILENGEELSIVANYVDTGNYLSIVYSLNFELNDEETEIIVIPFTYYLDTKTFTKDEIRVISPQYATDDNIIGFSYERENVLTIMEKYNVTKEDIEEKQNYVLYDVLLPYWFNTNTGASQFSMDNLGEFTIVDNTFQNLD